MNFDEILGLIFLWGSSIILTWFVAYSRGVKKYKYKYMQLLVDKNLNEDKK